MKKFCLLFMLLLPLTPAFGQGYFSNATTVGVNNVVVALPGAKVTICGFPATGQTSSTPCTNTVATFTDQSLLVPTSIGACTFPATCNPITADAQGNFGFWVPSGQYSISVCIGTFCAVNSPVFPSPGSSGVFSAITAQSINGDLWVGSSPGQFSSMANCYAALSPGQACHIPANWSETWTSNLIISTNNAGFIFHGAATINQGNFQMIIGGSARVQGLFIKGNAPTGGAGGFAQGVRFIYSGPGSAWQFGTSGSTVANNIYESEFDNLEIDISGAFAIGMDLYGYGQNMMSNVRVHSTASPLTQIGIRLNSNASMDSEGNSWYALQLDTCTGFQNNNNTINDFFSLKMIGPANTSCIGFDNEIGQSINIFGGSISGYGTSVKLVNTQTSYMILETESGALARPDVTLDSNSVGNTVILSGSVSKSITNAGTFNYVSAPGKPPLANANGFLGFQHQFGCQGTATSSSSLTLAVGGSNPNSPCTTADGNSFSLLATGGTFSALYCEAGTAGHAAGSGVMTVKHFVPPATSTSTFTCTIGTGTSCNDTSSGHVFTALPGEGIRVDYTTQGSETLSDIHCAVLQ